MVFPTDGLDIDYDNSRTNGMMSLASKEAQELEQIAQDIANSAAEVRL